ncbi:MAG TPA: serine/threonine-protein kinase, partial [Gemmatimonadales bacterium]|nr:serine/threonine-protein kinase [Gemmatimonadales bacterium]
MDPALLMDRLGKVLAPDYSLLRLLGSGGMGLVYLGYDPALDRPIAIKVLNPEIAIAALQKRFLNEARHLARLAPHPHVVSIHNVQEKGGLSYYIMDYLGDETLATQLKRGRFTPGEALRMGMGVLNGLAAAHRIDVVHRDIKPSNI